MGKRYESLTEFYAADPERAASREMDVGLCWRGTARATYRAAWVQATGELYLCRHEDAARGGGDVEVVARFADEAQLWHCLWGWEQAVARPDGVRWVRRRVAGQLELELEVAA